MDAFDKISRGFEEYTTSQSGPILLFLAVGLALLIAALVASSLLSRRRRGPAPAPLSRVLFPRLCRENRLTRAEGRILRRIAETYDIPDPVLLFFRRSLLESGAVALGLGAEASEALRRKLFGP